MDFSGKPFVVGGLLGRFLRRLRMGYAGDVARKSAWQFLNKTADPRLSMRRFAQAVGVSVAELFTEEKKGRSK